MDIRTEITGIRNAIAQIVSGAKFHLTIMPKTYAKNEVAIKLTRSTQETETAFHYRINRIYQVVYFGASGPDCLTKMEAVERAFINKQLIALDGTDRYLRIDSFSLSAPFETETVGVFAIIGMLEIHTNEAREQPTYEPINEVTANTISKQDASSWRAIDEDYSFDDLAKGRTEFNRAGNGEPYSFDDLAQGRTIQIEEDE